MRFAGNTYSMVVVVAAGHMKRKENVWWLVAARKMKKYRMKMEKEKEKKMVEIKNCGCQFALQQIY